ncbi:MAG TPA: tannase/feruloyl esterase family alpha/beta hydrolase [Vicinamibacterales bacterium]|jgi:feruloyl esterase|nr:tannase/feruloyl esterase family alpha/beta hydrolase [Vicinamibacterales bacterium]
MRWVLLLTIALLPAGAAAQNPVPTPAACERLALLSLPNTTITLAQVVTAGGFAVPVNPATRGGGGSSALAGTLGPVPDVPGRVTANTAGLGLGYNGGRGIPPFSALPAFCRVAATLKPSPSSDIHMELWMPVSGWNGNFRGTSPNGLGGVINYNAMAVGLTDGFAVASTDTGHQGGETAWMQVADKVTDFAGRAMHETTVAGKALATAYYGNAPRYSYMIECGGGSAAALHEVQKYPADYNGIVVGGHAAHLTRQIFGQMWPWLATHPNGVAILPTAKLQVLHAAVLDKCDLLDGVRDGLLENPTRCTFDPKEIECRSSGADGPNCLTTAQVEAVQKIYAGPTNPRTNEKVWSPLYRGSELDWSFFSESAAPIGIATSALRMILGDPAWDYRTTPVDFDRHVALADRSEIARLNASNPDISAYVRKGGKLILSGGWNNALVPAGAVLDYYNNVQARIGIEDTRKSVRLYMVPGMIECNGGPGTDTFDMLSVMRRWVERNESPDEVMASRVEHGKVVRTRPLCPYPLVATYRGTGSPDEARNFVCK